MKRWLQPLLLVGMIVVGLVACYNQPSSTKPTFPELPIYPNAEDVQEEDVNLKRVITFHTSDSPEAVLQWYQDTLLQQGWELRDADSQGLRLGYLNGPKKPTFSLGVVTEVKEGQTHVTLRHLTTLPM